ncbi:cyclin-P4-1 [Brachypodium distachyon]|uniref:Cyclin n=1 Tax=Brachypodium distachyon TaxID=15368 RepID=A0A0Q3HWL0_BRADI|nr:cyclin-P4-1 [Brachypodium distachyon]KQJ97834.1 hypothetical protein BRADI_3g33590v3 [Brachypodium distachyon]|eukprot:XP_003572092.3 cyclin-P4-1 [Brachypodium distachyon]
MPTKQQISFSFFNLPSSLPLAFSTFPPFITTSTTTPPSRSLSLSVSDRPTTWPATNKMMAAGDQEKQAPVPRVVSILSALLERVAERNDVVAAAPEKEKKEEKAVSAFQGLTKPAISVGVYLERIFRFAGCSPSCYVVAYIYLDRFLRRRPALAVDSFNVHRLLITSVLTAVKFVDDICYNNAYFARVGGISLMEMNYLEVDFLFGVAFDLNVTPATFDSYCSVLQAEMAFLDHPPPSPVDDVSPALLQHQDQVDAGRHRHEQQQLTV